MEPQSPAMAKKLWNFVRVASFMLRNGLISKQKLLLDMNLIMKKGRFLSKSWIKNIAFHNQSKNHSKTVLVDPIDCISVASGDYEFSCSNTPSPASFHLKTAGSTSKRRHRIYFPCIGSVVEGNDESLAEEKPRLLSQIEYSGQNVSGPVNECSHLPSPFSVRVSNYSSEDEDEVTADSQVDVDAEHFIRRFYEQLSAQCRVQLLEYRGSE